MTNTNRTKPRHAAAIVVLAALQNCRTCCLRVATVTAKGVVKGKKARKVKITVSANGVSKTFKVTVK